MAKRSITVELDDETLGSLSVLGEPIEVLAHLAHSAAAGVRRPGARERGWLVQCFGDAWAEGLGTDSRTSGSPFADESRHPRRGRTDESLRVERARADTRVADTREGDEAAADEVLRIARQRADEVVRTADDEADRAHSPRSFSSEASSIRARTLLEHERSDADAALEDERAELKRSQVGSIAIAREATDKNLLDERDEVDSVVVDQRDANEQLVSATIRAQEFADETAAARERAEKSEHELQAVAEFREMFIGVLGHDLRNPVASIVMSAALLLRRGHLEAQDAETVARIIRSSQRIGRMITQLLDLTRARLGGGLPIEPKPTDLREVCRDIVEEFDATIQLEVTGDVTGIWDKDRLAEVLSNLAGNAVQYSPPGAVVILKAHADGADVVVEIINQGDPISAEILPFIFEPFRRERRRENPATGNLGLGLYIAKQIVLAHGGTLDVHSAEGTTTFVMRLPRHPQVPSASDARL